MRKALVLAAVRRGGDQDQVPARVVGEAAQQLVALVRPRGADAAGADAGVGLVDDHQLGAGAQEVVAAAVGLDEVGRDDDVRVALEERLADRQAALQPVDRARAARSSASMWNLSRSSACHCSARCGRAEHGQPLRPRPGRAARGRSGRPRSSCRCRRRRRSAAGPGPAAAPSAAARAGRARGSTAMRGERAERAGAGAEADSRSASRSRRARAASPRSSRSGGANVAGSTVSSGGQDAGDLVVGAAERADDQQRPSVTPGSTTHSRPRARTSDADREVGRRSCVRRPAPKTLRVARRRSPCQSSRLVAERG